MSDFNLNDHVYRLLQAEPFFAALSRSHRQEAQHCDSDCWSPRQ
jgi:hypothetical protein